jgi:2-C-methyl-D-erythritol 2,4-cyclodiphosphate synthase
MRVGIGYDAHALVEGRPLILGGITIPHERGLAGHSDADAVIHAAVDALLGAAALGDIGQHFPSSDERWRNAPSTVFLSYTRDLLAEHGWQIANIDITIIAQRPRLSEYIPAMRACLARVLELPIEQFSIKATTTDHLGFTGREEGIVCTSVALIESAQ